MILRMHFRLCWSVEFIWENMLYNRIRTDLFIDKVTKCGKSEENDSINESIPPKFTISIDGGVQLSNCFYCRPRKDLVVLMMFYF